MTEFTTAGLIVPSFFMRSVKFHALEDGIRDHRESRGLGDVYKRQVIECVKVSNMFIGLKKTCLGLFERCDSIEDIKRGTN